MRRSTRKRNPPARHEDDDEPPPRKRQLQKKSQPPTAHKVHIPHRGPTQQHMLHSSATVSPNSITSTSRAPTLPARASTLSPNSHTSTSRAPTLPARASTSSPVIAILPQADMARQCLEQDIKLTNRQEKMRHSTRKRNPPARHEDDDEPPPRKRQPQKKSQPPAANKVLIPPRGPTQQHGLHSSATVSPNSHTSTSRAPTIPARASTPSPVAAIPPRADMAQQCLEQVIKLTNRHDKTRRSTRERKPPVRLENLDKTALRKDSHKQHHFIGHPYFKGKPSGNVGHLLWLPHRLDPPTTSD
ncbi:serine/arginine repetitive matrix protein 1-like [Ruditapes philippinarum]|uniref:serine/arginine repetitive matrix protein 1-like n=1 Tax=Ruditapes philippinarum TaxID=129788 RepID=UPI00295B292C|nr:serine/arginine repetitive matrix protein 1-like [Ruditapes philippinarum]